MRALRTGACLFVSLLLAAQAHAQICRSEEDRRTPTSDFTIHTDGTVSQHSTELMWSRCALGQTPRGDRCTGRADNITWNEANQLAEISTLAGHDDWRVPSLRELSAILDQSCRSPSINLTVFPDSSSSWFWTSTNYAYDRSLKWGIFFDLGYQDYAGEYLPSHVRLVRNVQ